LIAETTPEGLLLRPAITLPVETSGEKRIREFDAAEADLDKLLRRKKTRSRKRCWGNVSRLDLTQGDGAPVRFSEWLRAGSYSALLFSADCSQYRFEFPATCCLSFPYLPGGCTSTAFALPWRSRSPRTNSDARPAGQGTQTAQSHRLIQINPVRPVRP